MIIEYDFGKKERRSAIHLSKPAGSEPSTGVRLFGKSANARIAKLEAALRSAEAAASSAQQETARGQLLVDAAEYARLLRCKEIVAAALKDI